MSDLISRQAAIDAVADALKGVFVEYQDIAEKLIGKLPSAQPTLYGYDIEMLKKIADALTAKGLTPEAYANLITDIGRVVQMVVEEQREALRKALEDLWKT